MESSIFSILRILHIVCGAVALFSGTIALICSPNTPRHRPLGKIFAAAMLGVFITAVILAIRHGIDFLFCIAILSFFSVVIGVRALRFLKGQKPNEWDWMAIMILGLAGIYTSGQGALVAFSGNFNGSVFLFLFFGLGMVFYASMLATELMRTKPGSKKWFTLHQSNMGAALIATITAFSTTTMTFLPSILPWIWPTIILSPMLSWYINKSKKTAATNRGSRI